MNRYALLLTGIILSLGFSLEAQSSSAAPTRPDRGFYPNGSFSPSEFDTINNVNGNVVARIPITALAPGRGGSQIGVSLIYNSAIYDTRTVIGTVSPSGAPYGYQVLQKSEHGGWQLGYQYGLEYEIRPSSGICQTVNQDVYKVHKMYFRTPDGSMHTLRLHPYLDFAGDGFYGVGPNKEILCAGNGNSDTAPIGDLVYATTDGSYIRVELSNTTVLAGCTIATNHPDYWTCRQWRAFFPDGSEVRGFGKKATTVLDRNGNEIYLSAYVNGAGNTVDLIEDSAGRYIEIEKYLSPRKDVIRRLGFGQALLEWELTYQTINSVGGVYYQCADNVPEPYPWCSFSTMSHEVISKIKFPSQTVNGTNYSFDFDYSTSSSNGWGELRTVSFPTRTRSSGTTRATITFDYQWDSYTVTQAGVTGTRNLTYKLENPVKKRTLSYTTGDGIARSEVSDYQFTDTSSTITLPDGSTKGASFYDVKQSWRWDRGLVYTETMPLGRGVTRSWQRNPPLAPMDALASANAFVASESVTIGTRNSQAKTTTRTYTVDRNGNQVLVVESDWLSSNLRKLQNVYLFATTAATGAVPTSDETDAYWRPGARRNLRAVKRQRTINPASNPPDATTSLTEFAYDANWNVTQTRRWDSTKATTAPTESTGDLLNTSNSVIQQSSYSTVGNPSGGVDGNGNTMSLLYSDISGCSPTQSTVSNLYPTERKSATNDALVQRRFLTAYDCNSGVVTSETDFNNSVTTTRGYDVFGRPLLVTAQNGMRDEFVYQDGNYRTAEFSDVFAASDKKTARIRHYDDIGRLYLVQTAAEKDETNGAVTSVAMPSLSESSPVNGLLVETLYAAPCRTATSTCDTFRYEAVSTPYRTGSADARGWTRTKFDALGRPIEIKHFEGETKPGPWSTNTTSSGTETIQYDADLTTTTDATGRQRSNRVDGFGRLVEVIEYPGGGEPAYSTTYEYDVLDNLKKVNQGSRIRDFEYTSLSRLKSTTQPETGTIQYSYDNNGNLITRSDGRGTMTVSGYDALNRIMGKSWSVSGTASVQYSYDACPFGKGRLCSVTATGVGGTSLEYDNMGRITKKTQTTGSASFVMGQQYLLGGALSSMTYPTSTASLPRKVSYEYWSNGQVKGVWQGDAGTGSLYASVGSYHASGNAKSITMGNGLVEATDWNSRLQMTARSLTFPGTTSEVLWSSALTYDQDATGAAVPNDGNLRKQAIGGKHAGQSIDYTQNYTFDNLNRLRTMRDSGLTGCGPAGTQASQVFAYDRYGNKGVLAGSCGNSSGTSVPFVSSDTAAAVESIYPSNQLTGSNPDGSGNQQSWGGRTLTYDGENRLVEAVVSATEKYRYSYDGEGRRVRAQRFEVNGGTETGKEIVYFVYDVEGQLIAETDGVTELGANPQRRYLTQDHLGSTRVMTSATGTPQDIVAARYDYYPFGEEIARGAFGYGAVDARMRFTGQVRDAETGLDYFGARFMAGPMGRFLSPDAPFADQDLWNPQSWNLYAYVKNSPMVLVDPTGMYDQEPKQECQLPYCVEVKAARIVVDTTMDSLDKLRKVGEKIVEGAGRAYDYVSNIQVPYAYDICRGIATAGGAAGLGTMGLEAGAGLSLATGGTLAIPMGATGFVIGTGIGYYGGQVLCNSGGGGGSGSGSGGGYTQHGAERVDGRKMSPAEIADAKTGQAYTQSDGAIAYVKKLASGRYNVVVEGEEGIVTVMKNKTAAEVRGLAKNYGWQ